MARCEIDGKMDGEEERNFDVEIGRSLFNNSHRNVILVYILNEFSMKYS